MYEVDYQRASSVSDAVKKAKAGEEAQFLAGGQTLIAAMKSRLAAPSHLVDIGKLDELKGIEVSGKTVTIGAGATHHEIATNKKLQKAIPALTHMASHIGDPAVRYMGTIGGSIANNDPAADYPAAMLALDATIVTNKRSLQAGKFFTGLFETALKEGELIKKISFTIPPKSGYEKFRNPASRYAMTGVFVVKAKDGVRVAVTGAGDNGVFRATSLEKALSKNFSADALKDAQFPADDLMSDIHASAQYRANLIVVMARRAVTRANG